MVSTIVVTVVIAIIAVVALNNCCDDKFASPRTDFLAGRYPTTGMYPTASGPLPTPFHIYAADFYAIWATIDVQAADQLLADTDLVAIRTKSGRGIASFWSYHYTDTTAGPYNEVVILIAAAHKSVVGPSGIVLDDEPMAWVESLIFNGNYTSYAVKLWLSEQIPVDWGRDVCGIPKVLAKVKVNVPAGASGPASTLIDTEYQKEPVLRAQVDAVTLTASITAQLAMVKQFSLGHIWSALNDQTISFPVVFPKGIIDKAQDQTINPVSIMIIRNDPPPVLQYWEPSFTFELAGEFAHFDARPVLVQRQAPARAVLFAPHNMRPAKSVA